MAVRFGTRGYWSPEQEAAEDVDQRADLWSLCVVLWAMKTKLNPALQQYETADARVNEVPSSWKAFFSKAFAERIDDRFQTAEDMYRAFAQAHNPPREPTRTRGTKTRVAVAIVAGFAALATGAVTYDYSESDPPDNLLKSLPFPTTQIPVPAPTPSSVPPPEPPPKEIDGGIDASPQEPYPEEKPKLPRLAQKSVDEEAENAKRSAALSPPATLVGPHTYHKIDGGVKLVQPAPVGSKP